MICRLCLVESTSDFLNIFDDDGIQLQIAEIISKHFWFKPSKEDSVSDKICSSCWTQVASFHEFYCFIEYAQKNLVNNLQSKCSSSWLTESLPVGLDELKEEEISSKSDEDTSNDYAYRYEISEYVESFIDNNDPLTNENVKIEDESDVTGLKSEIPMHYESVDEQGRNNEKMFRTKRSRSKTSMVQTPKKTISFVSNKTNVQQKTMEARTESGTDNTNTKTASKNNKALNKIRKTSRTQKTESEILEKQNKEKEENELIAKFIKLECSICFEKFETFCEVRKHMEEKHEKTSGYVKCCNTKIFRRCHVLAHINFHMNPDTFLCTLCNKRFTNNRNLQYHIQQQHDENKTKNFTCSRCEKTFSKKVVLKKHELTHVPLEEREFYCKLCNKAYPSKSTLTYHIRVVHEKAYDKICDICGKTVKGKGSMDKHRLEHAGVNEPKIQCLKCRSWLKGERNFKRHMQGHEEVLLGLKCDICGKQVPTKVALRCHIRYMHEIQKNYKCTLCEKAFKLERSLKEHITTHIGGALYTCTFCPQTFNSNANMFSHRKKVHAKEWEGVKKKHMDLVSSTISK